MNIKQFNFNESQYIKEAHVKKQIYLHHTAGGPSGDAVYKWWNSNLDRVATCVVISGKGKGIVDGEIVQGYSSKFWAYHLGLKTEVFKKAGVPYQNLDCSSIAIEICNWGPLTKKGDKFYNYVNNLVPVDEVCELATPYKGHKYYHNYTDAQIASVKELLILWNKTYGIPLTYNEDIWQVSARALKNEPGIYTHNSVRVDKSDVYPHPKLITMLKSLI